MIVHIGRHLFMVPLQAPRPVGPILTANSAISVSMLCLSLHSARDLLWIVGCFIYASAPEIDLETTVSHVGKSKQLLLHARHLNSFLSESCDKPGAWYNVGMV